MTGLAPNTEHVWWVVAEDGNDGTVHSQHWTFTTGQAACPDPEPNDDFDEAAQLVVGTAVQGRICHGGDEDWFRFDVAIGEALTIQLGQMTLDYDVALHDPAGFEVDRSAAGGAAEETIEHVTTEAGAYRVRIYAASGVFDPTDPYRPLVQSESIPPPAFLLLLPVTYTGR